jgi:hypothetical protein
MKEVTQWAVTTIAAILLIATFYGVIIYGVTKLIKFAWGE